MDVYELREKLLDDALEYLEERFDMHKKFAKMYFKYKLTQGLPVENYTTFMPPIHSPQEAIDLAKQMEAYIMAGSAAK
jgi:exoribonuclease II